MLTRTALCDIQAKKIGQARASLQQGYHDPALMKEIAQINEILHIVIDYENKLIDDNMDID
jgi:hypothetical protein